MFVKIIVTPTPPVHVEHVRTAFVSRIKSPLVIQYVPGFRSTFWFLMSHPPVICVFPVRVMGLPLKEEPLMAQVPDQVDPDLMHGDEVVASRSYQRCGSESPSKGQDSLLRGLLEEKLGEIPMALEVE